MSMCLWFMQGGPTRSEQWGTTLGRAAGILDFEVCVPGVGQGIPMRSSESPQVGLFTCPLFKQERAATGRVKLASCFKENLRIWQKFPRQGWVSLCWVPRWVLCTVPWNTGSGLATEQL